jgi:light-regulated signal transduction histidine kinase (bacteriophytochrome)
MDSTTATDIREFLRNLIHDLRQPLSNVENSVFFLNMRLGSSSPEVREQLRSIEHQVEVAAAMLAHAAAEVTPRRPAATATTAAGESSPKTLTAAIAV